MNVIHLEVESPDGDGVELFELLQEDLLAPDTYVQTVLKNSCEETVVIMRREMVMN